MDQKNSKSTSSSLSEKDKKNLDEAKNFLNISKKLIGLSDSAYSVKSSIDTKASKFDTLINYSVDKSKESAGGSILDFAQSVTDSSKSKQTSLLPKDDNQDLRKILSTNSNEFYSYFQEVYQNKYIEIADLKFIAKFIPALGEAVQCLLDSITNSDDITGTISRSIHFDSTITDTAEQKKLEVLIQKIETDLNLQKKLKNVVYKTALVSGKYYVYAIPYNDLFEQFSADKAASADAMHLGASGPATEAYEVLPNGGLRSKITQNELNLNEYQVAVESVHNAINVSELQDIVESAKDDYIYGNESRTEKKNIDSALDSFKTSLTSRASTVKIVHSEIPEVVLADMPAFEAYQNDTHVQKVNDPSYKGIFDSYFGTTPIDMETGVRSNSGNQKRKTAVGEKDFGISGTYLRFIDPKNLIPVRLLGETIGYYYIQAAKKTPAPINKSTTNSVGTDLFSGAFNIGAISDKRKNSIVDSIVGSISNSICTNFSKKFVANNSAFKKAIADCITFNGFLDNEYHVQFIDAKYIVEFTINEDADGNGESVLQNSLFPAKILLSLITARMLNYLNLTGDKQIAHISRGPVDANTCRQTERVVRNMQEAKITFQDLLSTNLVFNKFSRSKNIIIPQGRDGTHLLDFEVMDGQNIDMNPEYENKLEQMAILGTGVPSVIMEYVGQADYAKGFENGNIKYAARVSSHQSDLEEATTKLYNILVVNSNISDEDKARFDGHFKIKLNRPKALSVANNNEYLSNLQQMLQLIGSIVIGESAQDPKDIRIKERFIKAAAREWAPYIDWNGFDEILKAAKLEEANPENQPDDMGSDSSSGMNY